MSGMKSPLIKMLPYVIPHRRLVLVSTLLRTVNLFSGIFLFGYSGYLLAALVFARSVPTPVNWLLLTAAGLLKALARYGEQITGHTAAFRILHTLREELFAGYSKQPLNQFVQERTGDLVSRAMADVELVEIFLAHTLAPGITAGFFIIAVGTAGILIIHPVIGIALLLCFLMAGVVVPLFFQKGLSKKGLLNRQLMGQLGAEVQESLGAIQDLSAFGASGAALSLVNGKSQQAYRSQLELSLFSGMRDILVDALLMGTLALVLLGGSVFYPIDNVALLWGLTAGLAGGFGAILGINRAVDDLPKSSAAAERILQILEQKTGEPPKYEGFSFLQQSREEAPAGSGGVSLYRLVIDQAAFLYPSGGGVKGITLTLGEGEHLFLAGRSGAGKTTLLSLILGFLTPQRGEVLLGGVEVTRLNPEVRYQIITAARQNNVLIRGTVQDNIDLGLKMNDAVIPSHALRIPEIPQLYLQLPDGSETLASGTEEQISGGQRRRLTLAAALAGNPRILVLDEAFAGLDTALKTRIRTNLLMWARAQGVSLLEVSHEVHDARDADRIVVLEKGKMVEEGTFQELSSRKGIFRDLLVG
jgi:ATP-binding cassette, subfamily C, bacterial CydC